MRVTSVRVFGDRDDGTVDTDADGNYQDQAIRQPRRLDEIVCTALPVVRVLNDRHTDQHHEQHPAITAARPTAAAPKASA